MVCGFQVPRSTLNPLPVPFLPFFLSTLKASTAHSPGAGVPGSLGGGRSPRRPRPVGTQRPLPGRRARLPPARPPASPRRLLRSALGCELGRRRLSTFWQPSGSGKLTPPLTACPRPRSPCSHEGTAQRVSESRPRPRPPPVAAVRALVAQTGDQPSRPKLGTGAAVGAGAAGRAGTSSASARGAAAGASPGLVLQRPGSRGGFLLHPGFGTG